MPRKRTSSPQRLDTSLLDPDGLTTRGGLRDALRSVENVCYEDDSSIMEMIEELNHQPHIFEYITSNLDSQTFERLSKRVLAQFPTHGTPNAMDALGVRLLKRLPPSLMSAESTVTVGHCNELRGFRRKVALSFGVLKELGECTDLVLVDANASATNRKKQKGPARRIQLDSYPFNCMGIPVPATDHDARITYEEILLTLKGVLGGYLLFLRQPRVPDLFKRRLKESAAELMTDPIIPSLYFDNVDGFGEWRVLLSTMTQTYLRLEVRGESGGMFGAVMDKMGELSQGRLFGGNKGELTGPVAIIPVYEAQITADLRLVYRIDCIPDDEVETQAICVFGIYTCEQMDSGNFWDTLSRQLEKKGPEYARRCRLRETSLNDGGGVILPESFPKLPVQEFRKGALLATVPEEDLKKIHSMLVLGRFVVLSQALLNSILANQVVEHVFVVSSQEQEIIESTSSCYVIGRSGTGKTTTMLFKMVGIEWAWRKFQDRWNKPRQIFVTQSRALAAKVEEYFLKLMVSIEAASYSPNQLRNMSLSRRVEKDMELIDMDDMEDWRPDLPTKFSELTDKHFPLFITYKRLCHMLQNDIGNENDNDGFIVPAIPGSSKSKMSFRKGRHKGFSTDAHETDDSEHDEGRLISYEKFRSQYWNHFDQSITQNLDPGLVFSEILGVIKGSEQAIGTQQRCLDRDTYMSHGRQGTFAHAKDVIYGLFTRYTEMRQERREYDDADRTQYILKELRDAGWREKEKGKKVDFLYVDEVQDNLLIDTLVLRTLCRNPHGLFWAGDTAQTISIGSSFKFSDLKAFQYRIEEELHRTAGSVDPMSYELAVNYRSHGGIVNCARSVVELITLYWPHSIDRLQPERALVDGSQPTFYSSRENRDLGKSFFSNAKGETVEFGADQCILVRDNKTKKRLKEESEGKNIIMTLPECKGLEFNDVLLYNFFSDSTVNANQWRLVMRGGPDGTPAPDFDETRHAGICTELKFLYVAITRARRNLWFLDGFEEAEPMKAYWSSINQLKVWDPTTEVPSLATESTPQDWIDTGRLLFTNKRYEQAQVAFQRAKKSRYAAICHAFHLRENARVTPDDQVKERANAFGKAGEKFYTCADTSPQGRERERLAYHANAADCFVRAGRYREAGGCFVHVGQYTKAARTYREGGHLDEMAEVLKKYEDQIEPSDLSRLKKVAQMYYFKNGKVKKAEKLFSSIEEAIIFAEAYGFDDAHIELLRMSGKIFECAGVLLDRGRIADAVKTLLTPPMGRDRARRAVEYLVSGLWQYQSFGTDHPTADSDVVSELLELAKTLKNDMREWEVEEIMMFRARHDGDFKKLRSLYPQFIQAKNYPAALLCLDLAFTSTLPSQNKATVDPATYLPLHFTYFKLLDLLRRESSLEPSSMRQKVFAFRPREDDRFFVPENGSLHKAFATRLGGRVVAHEELRRVLDREIPEYICLRAKQQHDACRRKLGADPCMLMATKGECTRHDCQFQHTQPEKMTASWFNVRVQSVLTEIRILKLTGFHPKGVILHWIGVLYSILHPPSPKLGSIASLDLGGTPESAEEIRILQEWIWQGCDKLIFSTKDQPYQYIETFIPDFMPVCTMAYDFDYGRAREYVPRTRMYRRNEWPECLTRPGLTTGSHCIVRDFARFLQGGCQQSLVLGSLFLEHILLNPIPRVDIGSFCDAVERLCGLSILAHRFTTGHGSLHGITLPRSWLTSILRSRPNLDKSTCRIVHFVNNTIDLLQRIDLQREEYNPQQVVDDHQFKHNGLRLTPLFASVYIARICFCLCLLGYNINDNALRSKVLQAINGLRRGGVNSTYRQYADARDWWGLVLVFTRSLSDSPFDEMVLLLHSKAPKYQGCISRYVRTVTYDNIEEIPDRLRARAIDRSGGRVMEVENDDGRQKQLGLPEEDVLNPNDSETIIDNDDQDEVPASPEEIRAVLVIEAAYHRFSKRKREAEALKGINATRTRIWSLLHDRASSMEWSTRSRYRLLMQGPLAHILVCLDIIKTFADHANSVVKKQLQRANHERFEELIEKSDQSSDLREATVRLRTKLEPSSPFHDNRSAPALKEVVLEVGELIGRLSEFPGNDTTAKTKESIKEDWKLGWDGIVVDATRTRKGQKPELVMDEEDLLYSY